MFCVILSAVFIGIIDIASPPDTIPLVVGDRRPVAHVDYHVVHLLALPAFPVL